jgi:hypothetical protein
VTTIGYGSIPIRANVERIFAMVVMIGGAVICDAGITAILTSIIHNRDQQSGENNRRIQCTSKFMSTCGLNEDIKNRVLDYYRYDDAELGNIDENEILTDLSSALREEVLGYFCYDALRRSDISHDFSDGAIGSLVKMMKPYLAIPNENLSVINEECDNIFVLKRGHVKCIDSSGTENLLPLGALIGHIATSSTHALVGFPWKVLEINLVNAQGFKTKYTNPYVIFTLGSTSVRSSVKKNNNWQEQILIKTASVDIEKLFVTVRSWKNGQRHDIIGSTEVDISMDGIDDSRKIVIRDTSGKSAGIIFLNLTFRNIRRHEFLDTHERTSVALGFCHLYYIKRYDFDELKRYLDLAQFGGSLSRLRYHLFGQPLHKTDLNNDANDIWQKTHKACNALVKHDAADEQMSTIHYHSTAGNQQFSNLNVEEGNYCPKQWVKGEENSRKYTRSRLHGLKVVPTYDDGDPEVGIGL